MWAYIDALIPGVIGLSLLAFPEAFTKTRGSEGDKAFIKLRGCGILLLVAAAFIGLAQFGSS